MRTDPTNPFYCIQSCFCSIAQQHYLLHDFWKLFRTQETSTPSHVWKITSSDHLLENHCSPFLFLAYKPRQAQNPMILTARPSRKAIVSPASMASTPGSTSSNVTRTRKSLEVFSVEDMLLTSWPQGEVKQGKYWKTGKTGTSAVSTMKTKGT